VLNHHSVPHRRDGLVHLTDAITSRQVNAPLPVPAPVLLPKILPLIVDQATTVRSQLLLLLKALPQEDIGGHVEKIALFIQSGMTHLATDVRTDSVNFLSWLVDTGGEELVNSPQGWVKTTRCFLALFGWEVGSSDKFGNYAGPTNFRKQGSDKKTIIRNLQVFHRFLKLGLLTAVPDDLLQPTVIVQADEYPIINLFRPSPHTSQYLLPTVSNCYSYLGLFGSKDTDASRNQFVPISTEDVTGRRLAIKQYEATIRKGLASLIKEGGELGRAANNSMVVLEQAFEDDSDDAKSG
jgi:pre-rRNA-processing protein IPI1